MLSLLLSISSLIVAVASTPATESGDDLLNLKSSTFSSVLRRQNATGSIDSTERSVIADAIQNPSESYPPQQQNFTGPEDMEDYLTFSNNGGYRLVNGIEDNFGEDFVLVKRLPRSQHKVTFDPSVQEQIQRASHEALRAEDMEPMDLSDLQKVVVLSAVRYLQNLKAQVAQPIDFSDRMRVLFQPTNCFILAMILGICLTQFSLVYMCQTLWTLLNTNNGSCVSFCGLEEVSVHSPAEVDDHLPTWSDEQANILRKNIGILSSRQILSRVKSGVYQEKVPVSEVLTQSISV